MGGIARKSAQFRQSRCALGSVPGRPDGCGGKRDGGRLALQEAFWVRREDIGKADIRQAIATAAGFDAVALDEHGKSDAVAVLQKASFEAATAAGVFGVPTHRYQDELYWGQDSLPFLERHLRGEKLAA